MFCCQYALSTVLALVATYVGYVLVRKHYRNARHKKNIARILESLNTSKNNLKNELAGNAAQWKEISSLPFKDLMNRLQSGTLKPSDVLKAFQFRAVQCSDKNNPITAFIENAGESAKKLDESSVKKPLHGIPVSIKECYLIPGTEATGGHCSYVGHFTNFDHAPLVKFLMNNGAVPFVKTNIPQGMLTFDSRNPLYGTTTNPHDIARGPGGSSSGEGALIAGGGSILGIGNDIGGSLRIPASCCGCVSLKPTSQRMLQGGTCPSERYPQIVVLDFLCNGFLARDVDVLVKVHRLLYSEETFRQFPVNTIVPVPFQEDKFSSKKSLKIAYWDCDGITETVPAMKRAVKIAKEALEAKGHQLVPWKPVEAEAGFILLCEILAIDGSVELSKAMDNDYEIAHANRSTYSTMGWPYWLKWLIAWVARPLTGPFPSNVLLSLRVASNPHDLNILFRRVRDFRRRFAAEFFGQSFDAILCPSFACPALPINSARDGLGAATYTCLFNGLNWPAGILPVTKVTRSDEEQMSSYPGNRDMYHRTIKSGMMTDTIGLPCSVQVAAPQFCEEIVLRLMSEIESSVNYKA